MSNTYPQLKLPRICMQHYLNKGIAKQYRQ